MARRLPWRVVLTAMLVVATIGAATLGAASATTAPPGDATTATARALPPLGPGPIAPPARGIRQLTPPKVPAPGVAEHEPTPPGLRRCVAEDGVTLFTDRRCELLVEVPERQAAGEPTRPAPQVLRVRTCARSQGDLLEGVRMALESRDPNRLAEFYHWSGMGTAQGYQLLSRLEGVAGRGLVDVQLVSSHEPREPRYDEGYGWFRSPMPALEPEPEPTPTANADLLRVDQLRADDAIESQVTWFHLRSIAGCWWLQF